MSRPFAIAFQSTRHSLVAQTRSKTLELYKSLLRSSEKFQHANVLQQVIRTRFKKNKYNTSRPKVLDLLAEANKTQYLLSRKDVKTQEFVQERINAYVEQHPVKTFKPIKETQKKKKKPTIRKPYQVAIVTQHSSGCEFKRVRGWVQPVQTSMMIKKRVKANQKRLNEINHLKSQKEMIQAEVLFLDTLGCLPKDRLAGFENSIQDAIDSISQHYHNFTNKNK